MKFEIEQEVLNKIIRYLATKPYAEVAQLISELNKSIKPIEEKEEAVNKAYEETIRQP